MSSWYMDISVLSYRMSFNEFFSWYKQLMGKSMHFPCGKAYIKVRIWRKRDIKTLWKVWVWICQTLPIEWVLLHIFLLSDIGTTSIFPMWRGIYRILWKHSCFGKNIVTSFPGSPHKMQFAAFSQVIEYLWENLCIFCVMKYHGTGIWWKKAPIHWEKYRYQYPQLSHKDIVSLHFLRLWKAYGKTLSFPI